MIFAYFGIESSAYRLWPGSWATMEMTEPDGTVGAPATCLNT
ncbi:hypothetical protein [Streptomyces albicerus]|nr:hypothetical protein [Streptomyces albicerus]